MRSLADHEQFTLPRRAVRIPDPSRCTLQIINHLNIRPIPCRQLIQNQRLAFARDLKPLPIRMESRLKVRLCRRHLSSDRRATPSSPAYCETSASTRNPSGNPRRPNAPADVFRRSREERSSPSANEASRTRNPEIARWSHSPAMESSAVRRINPDRVAGRWIRVPSIDNSRFTHGRRCISARECRGNRLSRDRRPPGCKATGGSSPALICPSISLQFPVHTEPLANPSRHSAPPEFSALNVSSVVQAYFSNCASKTIGRAKTPAICPE